MIREELKNYLKELFPEEEIFVDYVPKNKKGDYSTNLAFRIASKTSTPPMKVAGEIARKINHPIIAETLVQPPGFINFVISDDYLFKKLLTVEKLDFGKGTQINIEFVSVNPTGPINIVNARAAAVGDSLVKLLNTANYKADAEYYVNDTGRQIDLLTESVKQRMNELFGKEAKIPEDGYHGEYLIEVAKEVIAKKIENNGEIKKFLIDYFVEKQKEILEKFGVSFNNWVRESHIRSQGYVERVLKFLQDENLTFLQDGAVYFKTTEFGDDRDRVIITSDQRYTYLLPDIAYHLNKFGRKYDKLVTILGPDHLGQVKSLIGGIKAFGYPEDTLKIIIVQEVKLKIEGKYISMSKRAGTFTTLDELLEKIPKDVARFFFLMRSCSQHLDFDLDLALKESEDNPVYYVQYAYARIRSIMNFAKEKGIEYNESVKLNVIKEKEEIALIKQILKFSEIIEDAVRNLDPYPLTYYLIDLARTFHYFYEKHRVVNEDINLTQARLFLVFKTAETIKKGLELLGVSSPERM